MRSGNRARLSSSRDRDADGSNGNLMVSLQQALREDGFEVSTVKLRVDQSDLNKFQPQTVVPELALRVWGSITSDRSGYGVS